MLMVVFEGREKQTERWDMFFTSLPVTSQIVACVES